MYDKSLDQFATNSYSWQKIYNRPFYVSQYFVNDGLKQFNYNKRLKYYGYKGVEIPEFNWFDGGITYRFKKSRYETDSFIMSEPTAMAMETCCNGKASG
jgi:hypothetical protein